METAAPLSVALSRSFIYSRGYIALLSVLTVCSSRMSSPFFVSIMTWPLSPVDSIVKPSAVAFKTTCEETRPFQDKEIDEQEKTTLKEKISNVVDTLNSLIVADGHDPIEESFIFKEMFETEIGRSTIASVGRGFTFIPFYDYETFLGVMLRPMWIFYPPLVLGGGGYTGNFNVNVFPPRIEYGDRLGCHIVRTTVFTGLYINIGELGIDVFSNGGIVLLGSARVVMT